MPEQAALGDRQQPGDRVDGGGADQGLGGPDDGIARTGGGDRPLDEPDLPRAQECERLHGVGHRLPPEGHRAPRARRQ